MSAHHTKRLSRHGIEEAGESEEHSVAKVSMLGRSALPHSVLPHATLPEAARSLETQQSRLQKWRQGAISPQLRSPCPARAPHRRRRKHHPHLRAHPTPRLSLYSRPLHTPSLQPRRPPHAANALCRSPSGLRHGYDRRRDTWNRWQPCFGKDPTVPDRLWTSLLDWMDGEESFDKEKRVVHRQSTGEYYGIRMAHTQREGLAGAMSQGGWCRRVFGGERLDAGVIWSMRLSEFSEIIVYCWRLGLI